jgi:hypothetical protein
MVLYDFLNKNCAEAVVPLKAHAFHGSFAGSQSDPCRSLARRFRAEHGPLSLDLAGRIFVSA